MVTIRQQLVPESNVRTRTFGRLNKKKFITIHETANTSKGAGAQAHANLQSNTNPRSASWHWSVDDKLAIQSYDHSVSCWAGGDGRGDGNMNSIHIEICVNSDGDYAQAVQNAAELVCYIMKEENISVDSIVQHNRWSGKNCPTILRNGSRGINWAGFIDKVKGGVVQVSNTVRDYFMLGDNLPGVGILQSKLNKVGHKLTVDSIYGKGTESAVTAFQKTSGLVADGIAGKATLAKLDVIIANLSKPSTVKPKPPMPSTDKPSDWAKATIDAAVKLGITDGTRLHDPVTREEAIVLAMRAAELAPRLK